jgi:5-methylcytosine-specific restriction endonuclease McrA
MLSKTVKNAVFERANLLCEYCRSPMDFTHQSFEIDHIQPISKLGSDDMENLACACGGCNAFKHNKTHGKDPLDNHFSSTTNAIEYTFCMIRGLFKHHRFDEYWQNNR